jgi:hypothetical protein
VPTARLDVMALPLGVAPYALPRRLLVTVGRLELVRVDHPETAARGLEEAPVQVAGNGHAVHERRVAARCTFERMTQADFGAPQPIEIDPVTALEITARETVDEGASYIAQAIESDDPAEAKVLYGLAAGVLKTALTAVTELRKEAGRQS